MKTMKRNKPDYTRCVKTNVGISILEARQLIVEARINASGTLDVYQAIGSDRLNRLFSLSVPLSWNNSNPDRLLKYARDNMPSQLHFD